MDRHALRGVSVNQDSGVWGGRCSKHMVFWGATFERLEDLWREHVYAETGTAPKPTGDRTIKRWRP